MLTITITAAEQYDEARNEFVASVEKVLQLEHSLLSLSKWESKWGKVFLSKEPKTYEESIDYIRCMTITPNVDPKLYTFISEENMEAVRVYIESPMTATVFPKETGGTSHEIVTSEIIYYWMIALNIPFECQKWHINRLLTLIKVCDIKNQPPQKRSTRDIMIENTRINEERKRRLNTKG